MILPHMPLSKFKRNGLTLIEIVLVVAVVAILAGYLIPRASGLLATSKDVVTRTNLSQIRDAIMGSADKPGFLSDTGRLPATLKDLFIRPATIGLFDRDTGLGWRGPYLLNVNGVYTVTNSSHSASPYPAPRPWNFLPAYGSVTNDDPAILDPWGNPFILQYPTAGSADQITAFARLISAGQNGRIDTPPDSGTATPWYPASNARGDDFIMFLNHADQSN